MRIHSNRRILRPLAVAAALLLAPAVAAAQKEEMGIMALTLHTKHPPRVAYRSALEVLLKGGFVLEVRSLDRELIAGSRESSVRVLVGEGRDSTEVVIASVALTPDRQARCTTTDCAARELTVSATVMKGIEDALKAYHSPPRTAADSLSAAGAFGYAQANPIRVGRPGMRPTAEPEYDWLNTLRGPNGEAVTYVRLGSCCEFDTPNGLEQGKGLLDAFEVTYPGLTVPVILYMDLYDPPREGDSLPAGFTRAPAAANPSS